VPNCLFFAATQIFSAYPGVSRLVDTWGVTVNFTVGGTCSLVVMLPATTNYAAVAKRQGEFLPGRERSIKRILASDAEP
jgi:hypothetical protein